MEFILRKFIHELRNPLTVLYSTVQLMELRTPDLKDVKYWPTLRYNIENIIHLINDFSDFTKSDTLFVEEFDGVIFFKQLSLSFAAYIAASEVEYSSKINFINFKITGDKTKLQEVFWNLLKNAYEATLPKGQIKLTVQDKNDRILIQITDTGCGISDEEMTKIFNPFVTFKKNGTGLGLSICRQIIESHHGIIKATSQVGIGSTFSVEFPAKQPCHHKTD